jgi:pimeloyl-ACP methyl ester carboxylesterase
VLERYVGRYELNGTTVTVGVTDDGRLTAQLAGQPPGPPLRSVGANEFVADAAGVRISFDGEGPKATVIRSRYAGSEVTGTRLPDQPQPPGLPPVDETLAPYASTANSVELPDGRMLHMVCMGEGSPTVILSAGMGDFAAAWSTVQPEMAKITRVCSWDRPGFGLSDGREEPVDVASTSADLEAALATGKVSGPYVMVGHSLGSYETLLFADRRPDSVVGMVLVDPSIPDQAAVFQPSQPAPDPAQNPMVQRFRRCAAAIRAGTAKAGGPDPDHCFDFPPIWPLALRQAMAAKVGNPVQYETMASFVVGSASGSKQVINPSRNYRDMPLIVLSAGDRLQPPPGASPLPLTDEQKAAQAAAEESFNRGQAQLATLSTRGENTRVPGANHYIQRSKPQAVIEAVAEVVSEARTASR